MGGILNKAKKAAGINVPLTEEEAAEGLKEALSKGATVASDQLSAENGYLDSPYKILLPEEARSVVGKLKNIPGFENVESDLIMKMNEAAEIAASKAGPIFISAIKKMTVRDAINIVTGEKNAGTLYLENTTRQPLSDEFLPVIQAALDEVNARSLWKSAVTAYNKIPFVRKTNPELDQHVNNKALDGMFSLIEKKEEGIRNNADERTSAILKKVFGNEN